MRVEKKALLQALQRAKKFSPKKNRYNNLTILENVKIDVSGQNMRLQNTNLDFWYSENVTIDRAEEYETSALVNLKTLLEAVKLCKEKHISLDFEKDYVSVEGMQLKLQNLDEYPSFPETGEQIDSVTVNAGLCQTAGEFVSDDETRKVLNGIFFSKGRIAATNGHVLFQDFLDFDPVQGRDDSLPGYIVKSQMFSVFSEEQALNVEFRANSGQGSEYVYLRSGNITVISQCIDEQYPNVDRVIPLVESMPTKVNLLKSEIEDVCSQAERASNQIQYTTSFQFNEGNTLTVKANDPERETMFQKDLTGHIQMTGTPIRIGFNARYFKLCLGVFQESFLNLFMNHPTGAALLSGGDGRLAILMPLRLPEEPKVEPEADPTELY